MRSARHQFDGELLTVKEILLRVPRLTDWEVRRHLEAGRNTKVQMLSYDPVKKRSDAGKQTAVRNAKNKSKFGRGWGL